MLYSHHTKESLKKLPQRWPIITHLAPARAVKKLVHWEKQVLGHHANSQYVPH